MTRPIRDERQTTVQVQLAQVWVDDNNVSHKPDKKVTVDQATAIQLIQDGRARIPDDVQVDRTRSATAQVLEAAAKPAKKAAGKPARKRTAARPPRPPRSATAVNDGSTASAGEKITEGSQA